MFINLKGDNYIHDHEYNLFPNMNTLIHVGVSINQRILHGRPNKYMYIHIFFLNLLSQRSYPEGVEERADR